MKEPPFPVEGEGAEKFVSAFETAFEIVVARWRSEVLDRIQLLTKSELKVLAAIERKTIGFRKFAEKMPRRLFTHGETVPETGELRLNRFGAPVLMATGIDKWNLSKPIRGLVQKGMITRIWSEPHPYFGVSAIYSPMPLQRAVVELIGAARAILREEGVCEEDMALMDQISELGAAVLKEIEEEERLLV